MLYDFVVSMLNGLQGHHSLNNKDNSELPQKNMSKPEFEITKLVEKLENK